MTEKLQAMDLQRLEALLDAYGADPARWPAAERAAALALLAIEPAAQARLEQARQLDRVLDALPPAPAPAGDLAARIRAVARHQRAPAAPVAPIPAPIPANGNRAPWRFTMALAASAVIGLWLGFAAGPYTLNTGGTIDLAALDQQDVAVLAFGPVADAQNATGGSFND
ncbi:MAG: hypothetical protein QUV20_04135 [Oceanibaculum nanhaiense]|uniref:hypothetical protein n=1 Tax=Oceanibaculum nanhaiense TaxID=1909734 RepID=UPI0025A32395|nr:hypothetical protein [Oceanibaculum nanhaiense]MDM7945499.1 hypothetical protein [Oceanibaculum nanhaiense]